MNNENTAVEQVAEQQQAVDTSNVIEGDRVDIAPRKTDETSLVLGARGTFDLKDSEGDVLRTYHFQFPGTERGQEIIDAAKSSGTWSDTVYYKSLIREVFTDVEVKKVGLDWFDTHAGYLEDMNAADQFLGTKLNRLPEQ